jgi:rhomboid protease GluP
VSENDWIERVVRAAGAIGMNEVRVRWKLLRWVDAWRARARRSEEAITHAGYAHAVCRECGRIQTRDSRTCIGCGAPMTSRLAQVLTRLGVAMPVPAPAIAVIAALVLVCYGRQVAAQGSLFSFDGVTLVTLGAHVPPLEHAGQPWRLGTAVFLHGGIVHLIFNLLALASIGPAVEELFGSARTLTLYVVTGILANVPTFLMGGFSVQIGASGAIMGLVGVAAGWGQRSGTSIGKSVRNLMVKWLVYTTVFGFLMNADHVAHWTGFLAGAALGWIAKPSAMGGGRARVHEVLAALSLAVALACVALIVLGPRVMPLPPGWD